MNYYKILEIEQTSDMAVIRTAYNKLTKVYHPDKNIGNASAEMIMKNLNDALAVLSNPSLRKDHDERLAEENGKKSDQGPTAPEKSIWTRINQSSVGWMTKWSISLFIAVKVAQFVMYFVDKWHEWFPVEAR